MICSEARLAANRANALKSTGPRTEEGKIASRRNGLKHGQAGEGVVVPEGDQDEIARRAEALEADMTPRTPAGRILILQMATLSLRFERAARQEAAETSRRVRHAADDFDEERIEQADRLFETLADDPRTALRKLRRTPEGVDRLVDAWRDLRDDLAIEPEPAWTAEHLGRAANLAGLRARHAAASRLGALTRGIRGDFAALADLDGGDRDDDARRAWAKAALVERIDAEVAALEAHRETLDFETIELDRAEAGERALFDPSKEATLARRYEAEARRGFFKALNEFREVEALSAAQAAPAEAGASMSRPAGPVGSSRRAAPPPDREPARAFPATLPDEYPPVRDAEGRRIRPDRTAMTPG